MAKKDLISNLDNLTDPDIKKLIVKVLRDESISESEKEQIIRTILSENESSTDEDQVQEEVKSTLVYGSHLLFDMVNDNQLFVNSDEEVLNYIMENNLSMSDVVIYRKQKAKFSLEISN